MQPVLNAQYITIGALIITVYAHSKTANDRWAYNIMIYVHSTMENAQDITISTDNLMLCAHNKMENAHDIPIGSHNKMPCTHNGIQNAQEITIFPHNIMKCAHNEQGIVHTRV